MLSHDDYEGIIKWQMVITVICLEGCSKIQCLVKIASNFKVSSVITCVADDKTSESIKINLPIGLLTRTKERHTYESMINLAKRSRTSSTWLLSTAIRSINFGRTWKRKLKERKACITVDPKTSFTLCSIFIFNHNLFLVFKHSYYN